MKPSLRGNLWMLVAAFFFACMGVLVKIGAQKFSSAELVFYRSAFGLATILLLLPGRPERFSTPHWKLHLSRSVLGFLSLMLFFTAIAHLPLATAVTLNYTAPLFLALLALIYLRGETRKALLAAILLGFFGVALLLQPSFSGQSLGVALLGLISGLLAGIVYLQVTRLGRLGEPEWRTVFYFTLICSLGSGLWMLAHAFHPVTARDWPILIAMGACATVAQFAMTRAYRQSNPLVAGSLAYATVLLASLFGALLWDETLSLSSWAGIGLIVLSGLLAVRHAPLPPHRGI